MISLPRREVLVPREETTVRAAVIVGAVGLGLLIGAPASGYWHLHLELLATHAQLAESRARNDVFGEILRYAQPDKEKRGEAAAKVLGGVVIKRKGESR